MTDLRERVRYYVTQLSSTPEHMEDIWHSLSELGDAAMPFVLEAAETTEDRAVRCALIGVLSERRSTQAVAYLAMMLHDEDPETWRTALDALVTIGGAEAIRVVADAKNTAGQDRRDWMEEALHDMTEGPFD